MESAVLQESCKKSVRSFYVNPGRSQVERPTPKISYFVQATKSIATARPKRAESALDALTRMAPEEPPLPLPLPLLPLPLLPDAVAAGVAVATAPTPPVTGPLSWSCWTLH